MSKIKFTGIMPALVTPLEKSGKIRIAAVNSLVDDQLKAGVDGFYVLGGTGEGVLLNTEQRKAMAEAVISANAGRGKVIVHTGSIHGRETLELTRHATDVGADGISSVLPSIYFGYTMEEMTGFYKDIASNTHLPVLVYANHAGGGVDINRMVEELLDVENIVGAKDTRGNYYRMWELKQLNGGDVNVINGPDESLLCGLMTGADGGIGATYNLMPELFVELFTAFQERDLKHAGETQRRLNRIISVLIRWADGNIIRAIKESLRLSGYDVGCAVYPALEYSREKLAAFKREMEAAGYVYPG